MIKKIAIVVFTIISLIATANIPVNAATTVNEGEKTKNPSSGLEEISYEIDLADGDYTECSLEEFYDHYLEITGTEYPNKVDTSKKLPSSSLLSTSSIITPMGYTEERVVYKTLNVGYSRYIEVGCRVIVGVGQGTSWNSVVSGSQYAVAYSSGDFTWATSTLGATLSSDHKSIKFAGRGTATVTTTSSVNSGLSAAGFSVSTSSGSTYYWRKGYTINTTIYQ